jgi:PAS domain S-box-containing protein
VSTDFRKKSDTELKDRLAGLKEKAPRRPRSKAAFDEFEFKRIIHELQVHQIELEMQNRELRKIQSELESSRNRYADLYDFAPVGYLDLDKNGILLTINRTGVDLIGKPRKSLVGKPFSLHISGPNRSGFAEHLRACYQTGKPQTLAVELQCAGDHAIPVEISMIRVGSFQGGDGLCRATISDISERKRAEGERADLLRREQAARAEAEAERDFIHSVGTLAPMIIGILTGPDHRLKWLNNAALKQTGISQQSFEQPIKNLLPKVHAQIGTMLDHVYAARDPLTIGQIAFRFGDGPEKWFHMALAPLPMKEGLPTGVVFMALDITESTNAFEALRESEESLEVRVRERTAELAEAIESLQEGMAERKHAQEARQKLFRELARTQENERRFISRELHDQMGQHLTALSIGLKTLQSSLRDEAAHKRLRDLQKLADEIGSQVHRIACELRPTALDDLGLQATLSNYLEEWSERFGITADFHPDTAGSGRLPSEIETTVYRIVQEALTNVVKHARASHLSVILTRNEGELVTIIEDNGQGFDPDKLPLTDWERPRLGLAGIRERVALAGGTFQIESSNGQGTTLFARIPLPHSPNTTAK